LKSGFYWDFLSGLFQKNTPGFFWVVFFTTTLVAVEGCNSLQTQFYNLVTSTEQKIFKQSIITFSYIGHYMSNDPKKRQF